MMNGDVRRATQAICLTVFGTGMLVVAGLWPETTSAVETIAVMGWAAILAAIATILAMGRRT